MIAAIIISAFLCAFGLTVTVLAYMYDWKDWAFTGTITMIASFLVMIICVIYNDDVTKEYPKEYPASEYTFKIKVVEFNEQRDTILVVIPKEK